MSGKSFESANVFQDFKNLKKKLGWEILLSREKYSCEQSIDPFVRFFSFFIEKKKKKKNLSSL